jgi:plastocyanin
VVVTAEPEQERSPSPSPVKSVVDQVDLAFVPDVSIIPVGSSVSFPNSDHVSHQVYSFSPTRRFQLPLYRGQQYPPVVFDQPGIVTLGCNIHDNMLAYVVVTDAPFFGRTDARGEWTVRNAPPNGYRIKLWHPQLREPTKMLERTVTLGAESKEFTLKIDQSLRPAPLKGHPRSWDY